MAQLRQVLRVGFRFLEGGRVAVVDVVLDCGHTHTTEDRSLAGVGLDTWMAAVRTSVVRAIRVCAECAEEAPPSVPAPPAAAPPPGAAPLGPVPKTGNRPL